MSRLIRDAMYDGDVVASELSPRLARRLANETALAPFIARGNIDRRDEPELLRAWMQFLSRWKWDWFATLTFRFDDDSSPSYRTKVRHPLLHPERADKVSRVWVSKINRALFGPRWARHGDGVWWIRAEELQRRGVLHYHSLLGGVSELKRLTWMDEWDKLAGYARIEPPKNSRAVRSYCAKYVLKDGDIQLGGPLEREGKIVYPPPLLGPMASW